MSNVGDKANKIDNPNEELELSNPEKLQVADGKFTIISKTFLPPKDTIFTTFPDGTWVDVEKAPEGLTIDKNVGKKNAKDRIKVSATEAAADTAGQFPMKCEGNLTRTGKKGTQPPEIHWSTRVLDLKAFESIIMTVLDVSSPGLTVGVKGNNGTPFSGNAVTITQGTTTNIGTITIPLEITWQEKIASYNGTFSEPFIWVPILCNGISVDVELANMKVEYLGPFGGTDSGTLANKTLAMRGGNVNGQATGTWTLPACPVTLIFQKLGVTITFHVTMAVTIQAH